MYRQRVHRRAVQQRKLSLLVHPHVAALSHVGPQVPEEERLGARGSGGSGGSGGGGLAGLGAGKARAHARHQISQWLYGYMAMYGFAKVSNQLSAEARCQRHGSARSHLRCG